MSSGEQPGRATPLTKGPVADQEQTHFALQTKTSLAGSNIKVWYLLDIVKAPAAGYLST